MSLLLSISDVSTFVDDHVLNLLTVMILASIMLSQMLTLFAQHLAPKRTLHYESTTRPCTI